MKRLNLIFSALLFVFAGVFFFYADTFRTLPGQTDIGPAAFPKFISVMLAVCAVILAFTELKKNSTEKVELFNLKFFIGVATAILYFVAFKPVGFVITSMVAVFVMELLLLNEPFKKAWPLITGVAVIAPIFIQLIFGTLLKVPLPAGILAPILG